ncbi:MAG: hypothetical protein ACRD26_16000 [Vicinamibacterales bacterium]
MTGRTTRRAPRAQATTYELPPLVAALYRAATNNTRLDESFARAYHHAPLVVDELNAGEGWPHYGLIDALSGLGAARRNAGQHPDIADLVVPRDDPRRDDMARAVAVLSRVDVDLISGIASPMADTGFEVGFALACYLLTSEHPRRIMFTKKAGQ